MSGRGRGRPPPMTAPKRREDGGDMPRKMRYDVAINGPPVVGTLPTRGRGRGRGKGGGRGRGSERGRGSVRGGSSRQGAVQIDSYRPSPLTAPPRPPREAPPPLPPHLPPRPSFDYEEPQAGPSTFTAPPRPPREAPPHLPPRPSFEHKEPEAGPSTFMPPLRLQPWFVPRDQDSLSVPEESKRGYSPSAPVEPLPDVSRPASAAAALPEVSRPAPAAAVPATAATDPSAPKPFVVKPKNHRPRVDGSPPPPQPVTEPSAMQPMSEAGTAPPVAQKPSWATAPKDIIGPLPAPQGGPSKPLSPPRRSPTPTLSPARQFGVNEDSKFDLDSEGVPSPSSEPTAPTARPVQTEGVYAVKIQDFPVNCLPPLTPKVKNARSDWLNSLRTLLRSEGKIPGHSKWRPDGLAIDWTLESAKNEASAKGKERATSKAKVAPKDTAPKDTAPKDEVATKAPPKETAAVKAATPKETAPPKEKPKVLVRPKFNPNPMPVPLPPGMERPAPKVVAAPQVPPTPVAPAAPVTSQATTKRASTATLPPPAREESNWKQDTPEAKPKLRLPKGMRAYHCPITGEQPPVHLKTKQEKQAWRTSREVEYERLVEQFGREEMLARYQAAVKKIVDAHEQKQLQEGKRQREGKGQPKVNEAPPRAKKQKQAARAGNVGISEEEYFVRQMGTNITPAPWQAEAASWEAKNVQRAALPDAPGTLNAQASSSGQVVPYDSGRHTDDHNSNDEPTLGKRSYPQLHNESSTDDWSPHSPPPKRARLVPESSSPRDYGRGSWLEADMGSSALQLHQGAEDREREDRYDPPSLTPESRRMSLPPLPNGLPLPDGGTDRITTLKAQMRDVMSKIDRWTNILDTLPEQEEAQRQIDRYEDRLFRLQMEVQAAEAAARGPA